MIRVRPKSPIPPVLKSPGGSPEIEMSQLIQRAVPVGFRLPQIFNRFKVVTLRTDKTLGETDLPLLTKGLDIFSGHTFAALINVSSGKITLTFSRGKYLTLNEIILYGRAKRTAPGDHPYKFNLILLSDEPYRIGRSDT